jgi:hypothetical protein
MSDYFKIIAFIDPKQFSGLLTQDIALKMGIVEEISNNGEPDSRYYNDRLYYIFDDKWETEKNNFDNSKANKASIIIFPDEYDMNKCEFIPRVPFKILTHGRTEDYKYKSFIIQENCIGHFKCPEEQNTVYNEIATVIKDNKLNREELEKIWNSIPAFNMVIEAKLELLHSCLTPDGISVAKKAYDNLILLLKNNIDNSISNAYDEMTQVMKNDQNCFGDDYIKKLENLRECLLP